MSHNFLSRLLLLLKTKDIKSIRMQDETKKAIYILKEVQDSMKDPLYRENVEESLFHTLKEILEMISGKEEFLNYGSTEDGNLITDILRLLRNSCVQSKRNQEILCRNKAIFSRIKDIFKICLQRHRTDRDITELICLRCGTQFLGNAVTGYDCNQLIVWEVFCSLFKDLLLIDDGSLFNYLCMLLYNCMKHDSHLHYLLHNDEGSQAVIAILQQMLKFDAEWGLYILEALLQQESFLGELYVKCSYSDRNMLLDVVLSKLEQGDVKNTVEEDNVIFISQKFTDEAHSLLKINEPQTENMEPVLVKKHLECLCSATSQANGFNEVKRNVELLTSAVNLLHCLKVIGEQGGNLFTHVSKMSHSHTVDEDHPVFGLKRDLIRLVSNMAYKNKTNQDKVRELGGISLLLDHTNIDGRNPFITQWAVFAIRNLCDKNKENQAVIAGMKLEGLADNVQELRKYGVEAEVQGDQVVIKSVTQQPNTH